MLTTTHAIWSYAIFRHLVKNRIEVLSIIIASIIPDLEIIFWIGMSLLDRIFSLNPFKIDYNDLLQGSGVSLRYWPFTLTSNSLVTVTLISNILILIFKNNRKMFLICWLVVIFNILLDAVTHKNGNMLLWPFSTHKYLGLIDFNSLPIFIIISEQVFSFALLTILLFFGEKFRFNYG